ncbi:glucan 1,4-alpha-glucosidase [Capsulimonas corticalis]|uniref:Glucan 1,4-alpha-glucosidase n=1 Tax=Capsulimonas corticalis TaxID=2219043 RepID=A0A402CW89_9BACT|nr:glycoside hydrolase family 15 protein [Capsulimonas corticalis]BDI34056.1 glucan 1,4-alpha-glucosidase [Capsulimonas corticalis]
MNNNIAPGKPGMAPRWTSSAKSGVGAALSNASRVWFTISHGIVDEVYHPSVDQANTRDFGLLVTDKDGFFSEEKRDTDHAIRPLGRGIPGYVMTNTCRQRRYRITKTIITDPRRDVLLQKVTFEALKGELSDYQVYALLAPHLANCGSGNDGWTGDYKGVPMLFARRGGVALALACSAPWLGRSCGYVGASDGWRDIEAHKKMMHFYGDASGGNIALTGQIDLETCGGEFVLALGFDQDWSGAGQQARTSLLTGFTDAEMEYSREWREFHGECLAMEAPGRDGFDAYHTSLSVLRVHDGKRFPGGVIASLSIPWGFAHGDNDLAGYHVVWPRDQVEAAGAMLAAGNPRAARETMLYLMATQEGDGHWPQNMHMNGAGVWTGVQLDETALPILLADMLRRNDALDGLDPWLAIRAAAAFLVQNGPSTPMDRWEENAGFTAFTLAVTIAALLAAADFADAASDPCASFLRETADCWNENIERWTYVTDTELARENGVAGYYVRIAPPEVGVSGDVRAASVEIKNLPPSENRFPADCIVSPDALSLVRYGLRAADDPRIVSTVQVIDATLKAETATGTAWRRYTHDGYGETGSGGPYEGVGVGRCWPLLAGERAQYALALGNEDEARRLLNVMTRQTSPGGLLPEQIWDGEDIPERELYNGLPSGSGMPLVWAHAELVKLVRSLCDGAVFDMPPQTVQRYLKEHVVSPLIPWTFDAQTQSLPAGKTLRVQVEAAAVIRWSSDSWKTIREVSTTDSGLGVYYADLTTGDMATDGSLAFTFCWSKANHWEGQNFTTVIIGSA